MSDVIFLRIREDNNIVYKGGCESLVELQKIVYILLDIGRWVSKTYNSDIKSLLAIIANESETVPVIRVDYKLVEKRASVDNGQKGFIPNFSDYI